MKRNMLFNPFSHSLKKSDNRFSDRTCIEQSFDKDAVYEDGDYTIYRKYGYDCYLHCYKHVIFAERVGINIQLINDIKNDLFSGEGEANRYHHFDRPKQTIADGLLWSKEYKEFK